MSQFSNKAGSHSKLEWVMPTPHRVPPSACADHHPPPTCLPRSRPTLMTPSEKTPPSFKARSHGHREHTVVSSSVSSWMALTLSYKKQYIWSLSLVSGTKLLKSLQFPEWQQCCLLFIINPFQPHLSLHWWGDFQRMETVFRRGQVCMGLEG